MSSLNPITSNTPLLQKLISKKIHKNNKYKKIKVMKKALQKIMRKKEGRASSPSRLSSFLAFLGRVT